MQRMIGITSIRGIFKPEYLFRPNQILRKLWLECLGRKEEVRKARLPWGLQIELNTGESIGWSIYTRALYETAVIESNIPKFRIAAAEAQNAIAHRKELLRNVDSLAAADEICGSNSLWRIAG